MATSVDDQTHRSVALRRNDAGGGVDEQAILVVTLGSNDLDRLVDAAAGRSSPMSPLNVMFCQDCADFCTVPGVAPGFVLRIAHESADEMLARVGIAAARVGRSWTYDWSIEQPALAIIKRAVELGASRVLIDGEPSSRGFRRLSCRFGDYLARSVAKAARDLQLVVEHV